MFNQSLRKSAFLALIGIWVNSYIKADQPILGDLNLTAESQVIYYPTEMESNQIYWSDLSDTIEDITEKRNEIIKTIYSNEWWNLSQEASNDGQSKAWLDFLVDTEEHDILHNSVFATSVFDITSDQNYTVRPYTAGWI